MPVRLLAHLDWAAAHSLCACATAHGAGRLSTFMCFDPTCVSLWHVQFTSKPQIGVAVCGRGIFHKGT